MEVSGAAALDLHRVIQAQSAVALTLSTGAEIEGRLLTAEKNDAGILLTVSGEDGALHLVPYHAVVSLRVSKDLIQTGGEE